MKRNLLIAALAFSPAMLFAQTSPNANLQARLSPAAAIKSAPTSAPNVRVSTGIVAPKLVSSPELAALPGAHPHVAAVDSTVVVTLTVDEKGNPTNVAIAKSANPALDQEVLTAVSQYHFQPGTLDGQPYSLPVRLNVVIQRGVQY